MKLDALLRAHSFMRIERPPVLWEVDTEDVRFVPLLGEMIVVGLTRGNELGDLTLNASNVVVEPEAAHFVPPGYYVAVSVQGKGDWRPEWTWRPDMNSSTAATIYSNVAGVAENGGAVYAYTRALVDIGSITVFLPVCARKAKNCQLEIDAAEIRTVSRQKICVSPADGVERFCDIKA